MSGAVWRVRKAGLVTASEGREKLSPCHGVNGLRATPLLSPLLFSSFAFEGAHGGL